MCSILETTNDERFSAVVDFVTEGSCGVSKLQDSRSARIADVSATSLWQILVRR